MLQVAENKYGFIVPGLYRSTGVGKPWLHIPQVTAHTACRETSLVESGGSLNAKDGGDGGESITQYCLIKTITLNIIFSLHVPDAAPQPRFYCILSLEASEDDLNRLDSMV